MKQVVSWAAGILAAVIAGVLVFWLTEGGRGEREPDNVAATDSPTQPSSGQPNGATTEASQPLSFLERVTGQWELQSWTEAPGPITLYIEVSNGSMTIDDDGQADWRMDLDERGEDNVPQPAIKCGGQATIAGMIEGVPGAGRNKEIDWTSDLHSANHSSTGEDWITRALCGWATIGTRAPYTVTLDGPSTAPASRMEMANEYGTFRWTRP